MDPLQLQSEEVLAPEILNLLGADSNHTYIFGAPIHEQVASRWKGYTTKGIDKTEKSELLEKYLIPENYLFLQPPKVNEEVAGLKIENTIRQDGYLTKLQEGLGAGLAAISQPLNSIFNNPATECNSLLPGLLDGAKLILNAYHCISLHRRHLILAQINPSVRKTIENLPIEEHLFSNKLPEAIKASNEVQKHSMELQLRRPALTSTGSKNLKRSGPKPRLKPQTSVTKSYVHQTNPNHHHRRVPRAASPPRKKARYNWTTK